MTATIAKLTMAKWRDGLSTAVNCVVVLVCLVTLGACSSPKEKEVGDGGVTADTIGLLEVDTTFHDLGTLKYGDVVSIRGRVTNRSCGIVRIDEISTDCGCLVAEEEKSTLKSGETSIVTLEFDTHGNIGKQYHVANIKADNGQTIKICIFAEILGPENY